MKLTKIADDCDHGPCPALYDITESPEDVIVQGYAVTDPDALRQLNLPPGETAVRVPRGLLRQLP